MTPEEEAAARQRADYILADDDDFYTAPLARQLARDLLAVLDENAKLSTAQRQLGKVDEALGEWDADSIGCSGRVMTIKNLRQERVENRRLRATLTDLLDRQALISDYETNEQEGFPSSADYVEYERLCDEQAMAISAARAALGGFW